MDTAVLQALGAHVVEVAGLRDDACWVSTQRVALIRPDLSPQRRAEILDWMVLQAAAESLPDRK